ncbi:MAG: glucose-1-phosphate adenylyltransferase [Anaerolineae bacterium]|nr:glucose-1-phosphate adenylyltransferase [Anaerolineae bacterium]MCO5191408.1 glucose-1-phosphate adenylyltransferase [Anaerolineae bacterium]MCO5193725.1 glucose-1-phosphate adenylyltransferase [Anaerolineae bacterium]MCO5196714.1 glucose-1-phosphate adenylyltransferase [Anaerolineae bacterium]MCO5206820.1 glucose-1-phosphate adenylyltransferase [Anaerolineae bacterium]
MLDMSKVMGVILGGGRGTRLYPLTAERAKPAVPLAGKYRLIDIPMSNCIHAGIDKIAVLTQFNSASLHRHLYRTYTRDMFHRGWVQILAAEQTPTSGEWYQGTADAVRKQAIELLEAGSEYTLILGGDHLYRMNYRDFAEKHIAAKADISIAVQPVTRIDAPGLGILKMDPDSVITEFEEKPKDPARIEELESMPGAEKPLMASMGIYLFRTELLFEMLSRPGDDFGKEIIPGAIGDYKVVGYRFDGFWEDIGTIRRFYEVNLEMAAALPRFNLYDRDHPIYTRPRFLPGSKVQGGSIHNVLLSDGCRVQDATIRNSVIGLRSIIANNVTLDSSIMMGSDIYENDKDRAENQRIGRPNIGIGSGSFIEGAIIDKNARIGNGVVIRSWAERPDTPETGGELGTEVNWVSREGIVIVPKNAIIPDGTTI